MPSRRIESLEVECCAYYGPPQPPYGEPGECGYRFTVTPDDPVEPSQYVPCPRCGADVGPIEWTCEELCLDGCIGACGV